MEIPPSPPPEERFSDRVENYIRYRPGYPEEIPGLLRSRADLGRGSTVADIGSGTGLSTELLLRAGCTVHAVEPNREMREAAERRLAGRAGFHSIDGKAQATTLADHSIDLVVAAQAFHWFNAPETRIEFNRILKPGGWIALIWNERQTDTTPFLRDYEKLMQRFGTDYAEVRHELTGSDSLKSFFQGSHDTHTFPNGQHFDFESLQGRLLSSSYAPAPRHPAHEAMIRELRRIFEIHQTDGQVAIHYTTRVHLGR